MCEVAHGQGPAGGLVKDAPQHPVGPGLIVGCIQGDGALELLQDAGQEPVSQELAAHLGLAAQVQSQPVVAFDPVGLLPDQGLGVRLPLPVVSHTLRLGGQLAQNEAGMGQVRQEQRPRRPARRQQPFIQAQGPGGLAHIQRGAVQEGIGFGQRPCRGAEPGGGAQEAKGDASQDLSSRRVRFIFRPWRKYRGRFEAMMGKISFDPI